VKKEEIEAFYNTIAQLQTHAAFKAAFTSEE
jgi:hypothetical protein